MNLSHLMPRLPGYIGAWLLILVTSLWTFWGMGEMYYEGWGPAVSCPLTLFDTGCHLYGSYLGGIYLAEFRRLVDSECGCHFHHLVVDGGC